MIEETPNNYRELIDKTRDSASAIIRKCKAYMMSCLPQPHRFSVKEMALEAGVVTRTIEQTFQKVFGKTPNRVWCDMKLEEAHWYLEHPTPKIRLTRIAEYCGFRNLSRFAISYKQRFGEYPVETLQRGKSRHLTSI